MSYSQVHSDFEIIDKFKLKLSKKGSLEPIAEKVFLPESFRSAPLDYGKKVPREVEHARKEEQGSAEGSVYELLRGRACFLEQ